MKRIVHSTALVLALACAGAVALLSGCTGTGDRDGGSDARSDRHRRSGGVRDVYAIQRSPGPDGVPLLVVWTRDPDDSPETFDALKESVAGFLQREEGLSLRQGYLMDVFGPDGSLQQRLDARP